MSCMLLSLVIRWKLSIVYLLQGIIVIFNNYTQSPVCVIHFCLQLDQITRGCYKNILYIYYNISYALKCSTSFIHLLFQAEIHPRLNQLLSFLMLCPCLQDIHSFFVQCALIRQTSHTDSDSEDERHLLCFSCAVYFFNKGQRRTSFFVLISFAQLFHS